MHGGNKYIGSHNGTHSWGMCHSLMGETNTTFSENGYANASTDYGRCFISFDGVSINFKSPTGYLTYNYGDFAEIFYQYALQGYSINDALDLATRYTHEYETFYSQCQLYWPDGGYTMPGYNKTCYMRVWGDGDLVLPQ